MTSAERLKQLPGYLAFNTGVMFLIGLSLELVSGKGDFAIAGDQLRLMGFGVLMAVLAIAAGFASVARIEFARREGRKFSAVLIVPAVFVGLPLGRAAVTGVAGHPLYVLIAIGMTVALASLAWLGYRARQEFKA